jgi:hypothetical protein
MLLLEFSVKPFLKRVAVKPFLKRLVITPDRGWRIRLSTQTLPGIFAQVFFKKACRQAVF